MFNGKKYKTNALLHLKKRWGLFCLISLTGSVLIEMFCFLKNPVIAVCAAGIILTAEQSVYLELAALTETEDGIHKTKLSYTDFIDGFENWAGGLLCGLWFSLWTFLWSLLFIIPGILKALSYSMMFFVIAENPGISVRKAMNISKVMTRNHKADLFCFLMSFFGWFILCCITFGIGFIWLRPYVSAAMAHAYYDLKIMAFEAKLLKPADFSID